MLREALLKYVNTVRGVTKLSDEIIRRGSEWGNREVKSVIAGKVRFC